MKPKFAVAVLGLGVSCGPEMFNRTLELERRDAKEDVATLADRPDVGGSMEGGDARDAAAVPDGGGDGPCTTTFAGDLLYTFDTSASIFTGLAPDPKGTLPAAWFAYAEPAGSAGLTQSTTGWSDTEGHACPGSLVMTVNFTVYGSSEKVLALVNFNANWAVPKAYQHLHAWIKIAPPSTGTIDYLDGVQLAANTNNFNSFNGTTQAASIFADGNWHEVVLPLIPGSNYVPEAVNQAGVQIIAKGVAPPSGTTPGPTTIFIDDLWLDGP